MLIQKVLSTMLFTPKSLNVYKRLSIRYIHKNKYKLMKKSFEFLNEGSTNELLSFLKYKHITDDTTNSYLYIFIYELFYISIMVNINPNEKKDMFKQSTIHLLLYVFIKKIIFD